jgi:predicted O-methyltransferase YrrM
VVSRIGRRAANGTAANLPRVPLVPIDLLPDPAPLPAAARSLLADAALQIERYLAARAPGACGFVPCDHELVYRSLRTLRREQPDARRFCEWGSGFGVIAALAAMLGYEAHGIEVDRDLVAAAHALLRAHGSAARIWLGSFVPEGAGSGWQSDLDARTVLSQADAYDDMELDIDDFDVVYAYPWPGEEEQYGELFEDRAAPGALLVTFSQLEGIRAYRKTARPRPRR